MGIEENQDQALNSTKYRSDILCVPFLTPSIFVFLAFLSQLLRIIQKRLNDGSNHVFEEIIFGNLILLFVQSSVCIASDVMEGRKYSFWKSEKLSALSYQLIDNDNDPGSSSS